MELQGFLSTTDWQTETVGILIF